MQSRNFRLQKVGDLNWLEKNYRFKDVAFSLDEIIVLNASRTKKVIDEFARIVSELVKNVFVPIAVGGGIRSMEDAEQFFNSGADKLIVNSALVASPDLIRDLVSRYGSQSIVASVDYRTVEGEVELYTSDGEVKIEQPLIEYIRYLESLCVGEVYFNSIDRDGTGFGYDIETIEKLSKEIRVPLIIAGGAGNGQHLTQGLQINGVSAVATANLFNFIGDGLPLARRLVIDSGEAIPNWDDSL